MTDTPEQPNPVADKVTGYRHLNQEEIDLLNEGKRLANTVGDFIAKVEQMNMHHAEMAHAEAPEVAFIDKRWLSIARTDLQKGFMALIRSIAKPTSF